MMIIGQKIGSSQIYKNEKVIPVTIVKAEPNTVTQIKKAENGFGSIQIGWGQAKKINKPMTKHLEPSKSRCSTLKEVILEKDSDLRVGDKISVNNFSIDEKVIVNGVGKGKGFAGVIKRHGFSRGPETHGSDHHRAPGSIGSAYPQRVLKGKKMAGRMGGKSVTILSQIIDIDSENHLLILAGSIPGAKKSLVNIRTINV